MDEKNWQAQRFEENRSRLRAIAYRMLGEASEADDAVQETWLRFSHSEASSIDNLGGWLTTVAARICLDMLRARRAARATREAATATLSHASDAEAQAILAESIGPALLIVLDALSPTERLAFVLHDLFGVAFTEIAPIIGRSEEAVRQLASRARRRVQGAKPPATDRLRQRAVVDAFLAACRHGDFEALLTTLAPDVVMRADPVAVRTAEAARWGGEATLPRELKGATAVGKVFKGRALGAKSAWIDGVAGAIWMRGDQLMSAFVFRFHDDKIVSIDLVMDPVRLAALGTMS